MKRFGIQSITRSNSWPSLQRRPSTPWWRRLDFDNAWVDLGPSPLRYGPGLPAVPLDGPEQSVHRVYPPRGWVPFMTRHRGWVWMRRLLAERLEGEP